MYRWLISSYCMMLCLSTILSEENAGQGEIFPSSTRSPEDCSSCPPGYGVTRICDFTDDTRCAECPSGSYNRKPTKDSPCTPCSSCGEDYYEWTPCSPLVDAVCESCRLKPKGSGNENYLEKCERTTTPKPTTTALYPSSTKSGGQGKGDLEDFITGGQSLTSPEDDGSGEGSGELLPDVIPPVEVQPGETTTSPVITQGESTENLGAGLIILDEHKIQESSFSGWPILVAALVAALICFIIGAIIGIMLKRRKKDLAKEKPAPDDPEVHIAMVPNGKDPSTEPPGGVIAEERTPIYTGAPSPDDTNYSQYPVTYRHKKPFRSPLKTRSFGGSRDFSYIDEDSEDEIVQHLGRPPSIYFKDRKQKNKRKPKGFFSRLRRPRSKSQEVGKERPKVKRTESMDPTKDAQDESNFGTF